MLRVDVCTLFPEMFASFVEASMIGKARAKGILDIRLVDIRDFTTDKHRTADDKPYGGGPGMVLKCEPVIACVESLLSPAELAAIRAGAETSSELPARLIMLTPQGRRLDQTAVRELATAARLVVLCGHYEGFDERIREWLRPDEISIGDYILTGGEPAAMVLIDAVSRLVPGVLGHDHSSEFESFDAATNLLDYPVYTRPAEFRGLAVPEVLVSGDHEAVAKWRLAQAQQRTAHRRPDLQTHIPDGASWAKRLADITRRPRRRNKDAPPPRSDAPPALPPPALPP